MSLKTEEIAKTFAAWLERYSAPINMRDKPDVQTAERDALLRVLLKYAPSEGYNGWLNRVLDQLEYQMKTRAWPTKGELGAVCINMRKQDAAQAGAGRVGEFATERKSPPTIIAERIQRGDAIGDEWIYGMRAVELVAGGTVSEADLDRYRSGLFFAMKDAWGEDKARRVEADLKKKHEEAKSFYRRDQAQRRDVWPTPDKRVAPDREVFA